jgi:hypothetical protein
VPDGEWVVPADAAAATAEAADATTDAELLPLLEGLLLCCTITTPPFLFTFEGEATELLLFPLTEEEDEEGGGGGGGARATNLWCRTSARKCSASSNESKALKRKVDPRQAAIRRTVRSKKSNASNLPPTMSTMSNGCKASNAFDTSKSTPPPGMVMSMEWALLLAAAAATAAAAA